ncbi:hypothetical protein M0804_007673 [Polistes exclamans]|nr:hypothetical protein M0804_007673 [Polistes exclamans]
MNLIIRCNSRGMMSSITIAKVNHDDVTSLGPSLGMVANLRGAGKENGSHFINLSYVMSSRAIPSSNLALIVSGC